MENTSSRRSRRIQGLPPHIDAPLPKAVYLPPELKVNVLAQLDKRSLKSVRLVSKEWNALATRPLFDRVYISCREMDMEVFQNITEHPVMCTSIRELVYDASLFARDLDIDEYFWALRRKSLIYVRQYWTSKPFNSADDEINAFVSDCHTNKMRDVFYEHISDDFIVKGYEKHQRCAKYERRVLGDASFLSRLCGGLRLLSNLRSVKFTNTLWTYEIYEDELTGGVKPSNLHGPESGSPLVRSWNPLHLRPFYWSEDELEFEHGLICDHLYTLTAALTETRRTIKSLEIPDLLAGGLPCHALTWPSMTEDRYMRTLHAYSGLEILDISINAWKDGDSDYPEALAALPSMLSQMTGLKSLKLNLSKDLDTRRSPTKTFDNFTYQQAFPTHGWWPRLTRLEIMGLTIGGLELICLITIRAKVTDLHLHCIELRDGTLEGVVEGLYYCRLDSLFFGFFKHCGNLDFTIHELLRSAADREARMAIEDYVICGGRHPFLTPDSDANSSIWWYLDMMPHEFNRCKSNARQLGIKMPKLKTPVNVQAPRTLHESVVPS